MKLIICILSLSGAFAFVPQNKVLQKNAVYSSEVAVDIPSEVSEVPKVATKVKVERSPAVPYLPRPMNLVGYVGDVGFDPFGFSERTNVEYLREAELKHGRIATLAWLGWVLVDTGLRVYPTNIIDGWAGRTSFETMQLMSPRNALGSHPDGFWASPFMQGMFLCALIECAQAGPANKMYTGEETRPAGDLNFDVLKLLKGKSKEQVDEMKLMELKHVRLGMLAFAGVLMQTSVMGYTEFPYLSTPMGAKVVEVVEATQIMSTDVL